MRRVLRTLLTLLMCVSLTPGWVELLENLEHLVHDGHLAHTEDHLAHAGHDHEDSSAHEALEAEHGCTPMSHSCGCHVSVPVVLPQEFSLEAIRRNADVQRLPEFLARMVHRANAPPVRPPISA
jgi:hypothetical protein